VADRLPHELLNVYVLINYHSLMRNIVF
jgi:hypothetical protein